MATAEQLWDRIRPVTDPELGVSIVDLGLIYGIDVSDDGKSAAVRMTLTSPMCPAGRWLVDEIRIALEGTDLEEARVDLVWDPPWDPHTMCSDEAKDILGLEL